MNECEDTNDDLIILFSSTTAESVDPKYNCKGPDQKMICYLLYQGTLKLDL